MCHLIEFIVLQDEEPSCTFPPSICQNFIKATSAFLLFLNALWSTPENWWTWTMGFFLCVVHTRHMTNEYHVCLTLWVVNRINNLKTKIGLMTYIFSIGNYLTYHSIKCVSNKMIYKKCVCNTRQCRNVQYHNCTIIIQSNRTNISHLNKKYPNPQFLKWTNT